LSDTSTASVTGTALLTGQASTYSVDTSAGGWTAQASATAVYDASNGVGGTGCIKLTASGGSNIYTTLLIGTLSPGTYSLTFSAKTATAANSLVSVSSNANNSGTNYYGQQQAITTSYATYSISFTNTALYSVYLSVYAGNGNNAAVYLDNIDVRLITEPDRSVNNKGLAVYGTITKTAVATGSNLVAYSGIGTTNYLQQPYNSALDFGSGNFSIMGWINTQLVGGGQYIFNRSTNSTLREFELWVAADLGYMSMWLGGTSLYTSNYAIPNLAWTHFCAFRNSGVAQIYVNGKSVISGNNTSSVNTTNPAQILYNCDATTKLSLLRVSASAPSPTQIAKIYNDEKMLFQENSQCTLYGSSDAVTALAYDDTTKLLSVGTSSGRSDFQGLERINNTTTAVTTAISASNGLIAEQ
jgi:hypothetical protein